MKPIIALVGQQNVGKSTLFNRLTRTHDALVADHLGLTRDRIYGVLQVDGCDLALIDTAGLNAKKDNMSNVIRTQAHLAINEADIVLFLVDGNRGLTPADQTIAQALRNTGKPIVLVINKTEAQQDQIAAADFYSLGLGEPQVISAAHGRGIANLIDILRNKLPPNIPFEKDNKEPKGDSDSISLAVLGRPNVGKSTLINKIMGNERVITFDKPGTTRDSIYIPLERDGSNYVFIDTAGMRKHSKVSTMPETISIVKTIQALENANVAILMLDAREGIVEQDLHLAGLIIKSGCALVIAVNKWDRLKPSERKWVAANIERRLYFLKFANTHFISALNGRGINLLFQSIKQAYKSAVAVIPTSRLTSILNDAVAEHKPPLVNGRRIKFRYTHLGGKNPPRIIIHGKQANATPHSYRRYLENTFRQALQLHGTPIMIEFKQGNNPFGMRRYRSE